jgi:hypothetical protein
MAFDWKTNDCQRAMKIFNVLAGLLMLLLGILKYVFVASITFQSALLAAYYM